MFIVFAATHIALRLQDEGATVVEFRQGFRSMAAPTRELEKLIVSQRLAHGANPVTRWMASNVAVAQDPAAAEGGLIEAMSTAGGQGA